MSGHSKWAKIKHQKGVNDTKRGAVFTKLAKNITLSAKEGGPDPDMNFSLRLAVSKAKAVNMPADNIERAIKKASGGDSKLIIQRVSYEAMMGNVALIIDCQTDNVNRTVSEIKRVLENAGAKMVNPGSLSWNFEEKGLIIVRPQRIVKATKFGATDEYETVNDEEIELFLMEIDGVEDIKESTGEEDDGTEYKIFEVYVQKNSLKTIATKIEENKIKLESMQVIKVSKEKINVSEEEKSKIDNLISAIEENDDVDEIWTNIQ